MNSLWKKVLDLTVQRRLTIPVNNALLSPRITAPGTTLPGQVITSMPTAPATKTTTTALTGAEVLSGILLANQGAAGAATYTMPTGTALQTAMGPVFPDFKVGDTFELSIVNISTNGAEDVTVAGDTGTTAVGNMTIASNAAVGDQAWGTFRFRKTGNNAFSFYRVG